MNRLLISLFFFMASSSLFAQKTDLITYQNELLSIEMFDNYKRVDLSAFNKQMMSIRKTTNGYGYRICFKIPDQTKKIENSVNIDLYYYEDEKTREAYVAKAIDQILGDKDRVNVTKNGLQLIEVRKKVHPSYGDVENVMFAFVLDDHVLFFDCFNYPQERERQQKNIYKILSSIRLNGSLKELYNAAQK